MKMPEYVAVKIMPDKKGTSYNLEVVTDADFVNVVRCRDCKHRPYEDAYCNPVFTDDVCPCQCSEDPYYGWNPPADWFCPKGEKVTE